jgi:hypothetical protein
MSEMQGNEAIVVQIEAQNERSVVLNWYLCMGMRL